jgi:hypothetical protein
MTTIEIGHKHDPETGEELEDQIWIKFDLKDKNGRDYTTRVDIDKATLKVIVDAAKAHIFDETVRST